MAQFIGLDLGSSSIKGSVLDLDRLTVGPSIRVDCPAPVPGVPLGHFEINPLEIVDAVQLVLKQLFDSARNCTGIISCNQMAGVILADKFGNPLTNYLSWRDQRVLEPHPSGQGSYYDVLQRRLADSGWQHLGNECKLGASPSLLFWLSEQKALPNDAIPLTLGDFVWMRLCGGEPVTEYTNALGALNLKTLEWHHEAFEKLGIADLRWPRLWEPYQPQGQLAVGNQLVPCFPSVGDHQCALAGMLLQPNELSINVSTGSQISLLASEFTPGDYQVRPYFGRQFLNTITHLPAGRSLNVLVDLLSELATSQGVKLSDPWVYINKAAEESPTDLTANLAFFAGPMGKSGSIGNITVDNLTVGSLFRAAFESMASNYKACSRKLLPNRSWDRVVLSGGLVQQSRILRDLIQGYFPCPTRLCQDTESTLVGLLALALVSSGQAKNLAEATSLLGGNS